MVPPPVALLEPSDGRPRYRAYYVRLQSRPARIRIGSTQGGMTMTELHILCDGYVREGDDLRVGSTVGFVRDGEALVVIDPGMVAGVASVLAPTRAPLGGSRASRVSSNRSALSGSPRSMSPTSCSRTIPPTTR